MLNFRIYRYRRCAGRRLLNPVFAELKHFHLVDDGVRAREIRPDTAVINGFGGRRGVVRESAYIQFVQGFRAEDEIRGEIDRFRFHGIGKADIGIRWRFSRRGVERIAIRCEQIFRTGSVPQQIGQGMNAR